MTIEDYDNDEPITLEEYAELKEDYDKVIEEIIKAQGQVQSNEMDDAIGTLTEIKTDCSICQGEIEDAKQKIKTVNELCNIEKSASEKRCQVMSNFILGNLNEFVSSINEALEDLRSEANGEEVEYEEAEGEDS